ncbi:potassium channel family protein [Almyronema epifaneia]|uniref:potassium channel family protein n=1 Tax=Almyronema epifaneia TaxID=3114805 RepID=UPI00366FABD5
MVGASPESDNLIDILIDQGHRVALIESNEDQARHILKKHKNIDVFQASISQGDILEEARAETADAIVAATGDDSANLMAMFLGREYGIETLVSIINEPKHHSMFERLGVKVLANPAAIIAQQLYRLIEKSRSEAKKG